ncbi:hypothetical protein GLW08_11295 [Pontibacillus yanchengensis]|uniref:Uncharacterized protein n=2 Tax=Pontibacillus yanchengensis TaxID=462910 RepID=A0A6I4ZZM3_9BACI|nr:hypothetical protein [Pontibacillus yanchengensis]MYL33897.1 hypothetical protein [Pontibacillus yanchengensis]MYL53922.1 hypothetical protein [Pontibacillus yanchengensis]
MVFLVIATFGVSIYVFNDDEFAANNTELMGILLSSIIALSGIRRVKDHQKK